MLIRCLLPPLRYYATPLRRCFRHTIKIMMPIFSTRYAMLMSFSDGFRRFYAAAACCAMLSPTIDCRHAARYAITLRCYHYAAAITLLHAAFSCCFSLPLLPYVMIISPFFCYATDAAAINFSLFRYAISLDAIRLPDVYARYAALRIPAITLSVAACTYAARLMLRC